MADFGYNDLKKKQNKQYYNQEKNNLRKEMSQLELELQKFERGNVKPPFRSKENTSGSEDTNKN